MATFLLLLALVFFVGWVVAEFKAGKARRMALGMACMVMLVLGMTLDHVEAAVYFAKTNMWYERSFTYIAVLIEHDRAADIPPAIHRYRATVSEAQDHLSAAADLMAELGQAYGALEDKTDGSTQEK